MWLSNLNIDTFNADKKIAFSNDLNKLINLIFGSFSGNLDATIISIPNPPVYMVLLCRLFGKITKPYSLNAPPNGQMYTFYAVISCQEYHSLSINGLTN
jgi:hypothetical protein